MTHDMRSLRSVKGAPEVHSVGINYRHAAGFCIDYPEGLGIYFFLYFLTPVVFVETKKGIEHRLGADTCIICEPDFAVSYSGDGVGLGNDFIRIAGEVATLLEKYDLPVNTPFELLQSNFVRDLFGRMEREILEQHDTEKRSLELLLELFFINLSRYRIHDSAQWHSRRTREWEHSLREVRRNFLSDCRHRWTVPEMASSVHISPSRFAVLYKKIFGVSPLEDLMRTRMERAVYLLSGTNLPIGMIAEDCGFDSVYYFSRAFKKRFGCAPSRYVKKN